MLQLEPYYPITPFYLMKHLKEPHSDKPPEDPRIKILGLNKAVEATEKSIREYKAQKWDASVFEAHLRVLEQCIKNIRKQMTEGK